MLESPKIASTPCSSEFELWFKWLPWGVSGVSSWELEDARSCSKFDWECPSEVTFEISWDSNCSMASRDICLNKLKMMHMPQNKAQMLIIILIRYNWPESLVLMISTKRSGNQEAEKVAIATKSRTKLTVLTLVLLFSLSMLRSPFLIFFMAENKINTFRHQRITCSKKNTLLELFHLFSLSS